MDQPKAFTMQMQKKLLPTGNKEWLTEEPIYDGLIDVIAHESGFGYMRNRIKDALLIKGRVRFAYRLIPIWHEVNIAIGPGEIKKFCTIDIRGSIPCTPQFQEIKGEAELTVQVVESSLTSGNHQDSIGGTGTNGTTRQ